MLEFTRQSSNTKVCTVCGLIQGSTNHQETLNQYHAPALVNISTGEVQEIQVYDYEPTYRLKVSSLQYPNMTSQIMKDGLLNVRDAGIECSVYIPVSGRQSLNKSLYCKECLKKIENAQGNTDYVMLDTFDINNIKAYKIEDNIEYVIRDYIVRITPTDISGDDNRLKLQVVGQVEGLEYREYK